MDLQAQSNRWTLKFITADIGRHQVFTFIPAVKELRINPGIKSIQTKHTPAEIYNSKCNPDEMFGMKI